MKTVSHTPVPTVFIKSKFWRQLWELVSGILSSVLCPSVSLTTNCQAEKDEVIHRDWVRLILSRVSGVGRLSFTSGQRHSRNVKYAAQQA